WVQSGSTSAHNPSRGTSNPPGPPATRESLIRHGPAASDVAHCCVDVAPPETPQHSGPGSCKSFGARSSTTYKMQTPSPLQGQQGQQQQFSGALPVIKE